ncbi:MAG: TonB-dependent receptor [Sphingomonas adhaesiva]|uniref:TonB-dependent receptor n=1 Tax=Sphingomonas adhaesiva TaxID=28212 RepID=UPI002FFB0409
MRRRTERVAAGVLALAVVLAASGAAADAPSDAPADPTSDIVVQGQAGRLTTPFETRHALDARAIDAIAANSVDEIVRRLPSLAVPVNSRGEAIAVLRGAAERQVAVFYDGAAINVPWDNRLDLSLLPAALVGSARVAVAPLAPLYGVNALGAVSFSPREPDGTVARGLIGSGRLREVQAIAPLVSGDTSLVVGGGASARRGEPLSHAERLPYSQPAEGLRTNTDRDLASVFARLATERAGRTLSLTAFHVDAGKGIAPEGDRASGARFWRYPTVRHTLISANAGLALTPDTSLMLVGWHQRFDQVIDSYTTASYDRRDAQEANRDRTWGARALLSQAAGEAVRLTVSGNVLDSVHDQRDIAFTGGAAPAILPGYLRYRQRNWALGGDAAVMLTPRLTAEAGGGYDRVDYLVTGDKPAIPAVGGWTGRAALAWEMPSGWRLRAALGRKIRAATMRELFGQALNRFLLNPDLQPERIVSAEMAAEWRGRDAEVFVVAFGQDLDGTIDQRNVGRLRQRINLTGSTVKGVEAGGAWRPAPGWSLGGNATFSRVRRKGAAPGTLNRLAERPSVLSRGYGGYTADGGFNALAEVLYTGRAYSADANGVLVALPRSTAVNLRVGQRVAVAGRAIELFARADNIGDALVLPQLGLPAPGRTLRIGLAVGNF